MLIEQTVAEPMAAHLRKALNYQSWNGTMPVRDVLTRELGVHGSTVERALHQLEREGLVKKAGSGMPRGIVVPSKCRANASSVCVLLHDGGIKRTIKSSARSIISVRRVNMGTNLGD